jgi:hypothetical protein
MIVAEQKPFEEIYAFVAAHSSVLIVGCGTCTTVSMSGGERQVATLASQLRIAARRHGHTVYVDEDTIERQCEQDFFRDIRTRASSVDAVISMACGAGVQLLSEQLETTPVYPALNTRFIGIDNEVGTWEERCRMCGECILGETAGICPMTMCAKSLCNGPCGGAQDGMCEVDPERECAWIRIYRRLEQRGELPRMADIRPPHSHRIDAHPNTQRNSSIKTPASPHTEDAPQASSTDDSSP